MKASWARAPDLAGIFVLAVLSFGLAGFIAIGDARAGLRDDLYVSTRHQTQVAVWYSALSILPWISSFSTLLVVVFGSQANVLLPPVLWFVLIADGFGKLATGEGARHMDAA